LRHLSLPVRGGCRWGVESFDEPDQQRPAIDVAQYELAKPLILTSDGQLEPAIPVSDEA
jgi:hypothetical protein